MTKTLITIRPRVRILKAATTILTVGAFALSTSGYALFYGHKLNGGVYDRKYWLDGSVDSNLASQIYSSKWLWGNASSKIAINESSSVSNSQILFFESSTMYASLGFCGLFIPTDNGLNTVNNLYQSWDRAKVLLSNRVVSDTPDCYNGQGIITHELGHVFGLAHVEYGTAVMRLDIAYLNYTAPKLDDVNGIKALYK
jgi:hypothetical protein